MYKESKSISSAFENLNVETAIDQQTDRTFVFTKDAATSSTEYNFRSKLPTCGCETYEKPNFQLVTQEPEILNYQVLN